MKPTDKCYRIAREAIRILAARPQGMRSREFSNTLRACLPDLAPLTVRNAMTRLPRICPGIKRPVRGGTYRLDHSAEDVFLALDRAAGLIAPAEQPVAEHYFYQPLAEWLTGELGLPCHALGGHDLGDYWGTPDVLGVLRDGLGQIARLVAVEVKGLTGALVEGFGQCCAYKLFSHAAYLAVPRAAHFSELARLELLCKTQNVGLLTFDASAPASPAFELRCRAAELSPDPLHLAEKSLLLAPLLVGPAPSPLG